MKRRKLNTAAFTLVELVVVILIVGIMITVWSSFFYSIQNQTTNRLTQWEVNLFNDSINSLKVSDLYLSEYYNTDDYAVLNSLSKESFIDLYYSIEVIKPVLVNKFDSPLLPLLPSDIWNVSNWYSDIVIALQKCKFLFHTELESIDSNDYVTSCEDPIIWESAIYLQWFLVSNSSQIFIEKNNYQFTDEGYFWYTFDIYDNQELLVQNWNKVSWFNEANYKYFDLLNSTIDDFLLNNFFIYKVEGLDWEEQRWVFFWTESEFTDILYNEYYPGIVKGAILDTSDIWQDLLDRKNYVIGQFSDIIFFYNNPNDISEGYKEIIYIWNKNYEKN